MRPPFRATDSSRKVLAHQIILRSVDELVRLKEISYGGIIVHTVLYRDRVFIEHELNSFSE